MLPFTCELKVQDFSELRRRLEVLYVPAYSFYAVLKCCSAASSGQYASDRISRGLLTVVGPGKFVYFLGIAWCLCAP